MPDASFLWDGAEIHAFLMTPREVKPGLHKDTVWNPRTTSDSCQDPLYTGGCNLPAPAPHIPAPSPRSACRNTPHSPGQRWRQRPSLQPCRGTILRPMLIVPQGRPQRVSQSRCQELSASPAATFALSHLTLPAPVPSSCFGSPPLPIYQPPSTGPRRGIGVPNQNRWQM